MLIGYYTGMLLISLLFLFSFIWLGIKFNICYILTYVTIVITNFGYLSLALSTSTEEALLANRVVYLGGVFLPFFLFLIMVDLCRIKIPHLAVGLLTGYNFLVLLCTFSPGFSSVYYRSVELRQFLGSTYLVKEYGPLHSAYLVHWLCFMLVMVIIVGISMFRQQMVSYKTANMLSILVIMNALIYLTERLIKVPIELMPLSYCISEGLVLARLRSINLYDMSSNIMNVMQHRNEYGYFTFTTDLKFVNTNEFATSIYPEVRTLRIDHHVGDDDTPFRQEIMLWLEPLSRGEDVPTEKMIVHGSQILKCSVKKIYQGSNKRYVGYLVEILDDTKQQNYITMIEKFNETLEQEVDKKTANLQRMQEGIILSFANMVESRDHVTGGHIKRSSGYVRILADKLAQMDLFPEFQDPEYIKDICMAAPLHDIGKIAIPDSILNKPGKYEPQEYEIMKKHPLLGGNILDETLSTLEDQKYYQIAWQTAMFHHERWDGNGYPTRLSGEEIPLCARVMAIADVFDALTSRRPYKDEFTLEQAFDIIYEGKGTQFDPRLVDVCMACKEEFASFCIEQKEAGEKLSKDDLDNLMQTVFNEEEYSNAYQVSYAEWGKFVSYIKNLAIRNKQNMYLIMFTIDSKSNQYLTDDQKRLAMINLKLSVVSSLRSSDMTTQISNIQRVVMLLNIDYSGIRIVTKRIRDAFDKQNTDEDITINYVVTNPLREEHNVPIR
ncbi:MAG: HD domain-containing protein [Roseburia sp.]|nr:HD domain-containing protein [Roseburia sp.]